MQNQQSCDNVFCDSLLASIGDWFDCAMCQMFVFGICLVLASACLLQFLGHSSWFMVPLGHWVLPFVQKDLICDDFLDMGFMMSYSITL